jgi:hypothetical protein
MGRRNCPFFILNRYNLNVHTADPAATISIPELRENLIDEIYKAGGFSEAGWLRKAGGWLFRKPADRLADFASGFDRAAGEAGLPAAAEYALDSLGQTVQVRGEQTIPLDGGLIIAGNHPGTFDGFCVLANLPRKDVRFIVSGVPLTHSLPNTEKYLIYAPGDKHERMLAIRSMIRYLQEGGTVMIFPSGRLDPDPDVLPGAEQALELWSPSLEILLRRAPNTQVVVAITGGVFAPQVLKNPLTGLQTGWRKQKLAEFIQVGRMLSNPHAYELHPRVTFSPPLLFPTPDIETIKQNCLPQLIAFAKNTLQVHQSWQINKSS